MILRPPEIHEYETIYLMGVDVWGEGVSQSEYFIECRNSTKYARGTWLVLSQTCDSTPVSSILAHDFGEYLGQYRFFGVGSLATSLAVRKQGYGSKLLGLTVSALYEQGATHLFLCADIAPEFYGKAGFRPFRTLSNGSIQMFHGVSDPTGEKLTLFADHIPNYF